MAPTDLPAPDLAPYTEAQLRFAVGAWPMRAAQELRSALIFRALAQASRASRVGERWPWLFASAMRDEVRHASLCARAGKALGAMPPVYDARPVSARLASLPEPAARVAALLLVEVAVGETISMYIFRAARRAAREPLTRAVLRVILGDEVRHQRIGWAGLAALLPSIDARLRRRLDVELASGFATCEQQNARPALAWLKSRRPFDPAFAALGVLHPEARVEAFYTAVERLVIPRLAKVGFDGQRIWERRYRGR
jgi:hypothetical protein